MSSNPSTQSHDIASRIPEWSLADKFRKVRLEAGLSQRELADRIGVKHGSYGQWEAGNSRPRDLVAVTKRLELLTGAQAWWILGLDEENRRPDGPDGGTECATRDSNPQPSDPNVVELRPHQQSFRQADTLEVA